MNKEQTTYTIKNPKNKKIAIIKANFNPAITNKLLQITVKTLKNYKIKHDIFEVSGAFEIPYLIKKNINKYDGFVALGCLIEGKTLHFKVIAYSLCKELMHLSTQFLKPIGFGVLTLKNKKQARARIKNAQQAALAVLDLLSK